MTQQYKEQSKDTKNNLNNSYRHAERNQTKQSMIPYDVQIQVKTYADKRKNNSFSWKEILTRKGT